MAAGGVATFLRENDESTATGVGAGIGAIAAGLIVALVVRAIYTKLFARERPIWSPWFLLIAGLTLLITVPARAEQEQDEVTEEGEAYAEECADLGYASFPPAPRPYEYRSLRPAEEERFTTELPEELGGLVEGRVLIDRSTPVAVIGAAAIGTDPERETDVIEGFIDGATESGREVESGVTAEGASYRIAGDPQTGWVAIGFGACHVRFIGTADEAGARQLADVFFGAD